MAVTLADLAGFVGAYLGGADTASATAKVQSALDTSVLLVDDALSSSWRPVPATVRDRLVLEVGHAVYKRQDSPSGSSQGVDFSSGQPVMGPRDPLAQVWPIIRRYVAPF